MTLTLWIPEVFASFRKKSFLPSILLCTSNFSHCSFVICFTLLTLAWFLILALSCRYFSTSCNTLWNSMDEIFPSCTTCEMILDILSNLLWAISLIALCFSCFTVKVLEAFCVMTVTRERSRLVPLKAMPTGRWTTPANAVIEFPPVIAFDVMRPVSTMPVIALNRLIFWQSVHEL